MELRGYQKNNADMASKLLTDYKIAYLAMETRTGKTITAFATCEKFGAKKILFVTKKKAISSIENDALHFSELSITVVNYESVLKKAGDYDVIICDEAHSLGAYPKPAKRVKDMVSITEFKPIIFISATPAPESHSQFFHQLFISSFSPWCGYKNFYHWAKKYIDVGKKYLHGREINDYSNAKKSLIATDIAHLMIKTTQKEAGFEKTIGENVLNVCMSDLQKKMIKKLKKDRILIGSESGEGIIADTAVKLQQKIHQLSSGTVKTESGKRLIISREKAIFIRDFFENKKIAIFYKFIAEFELLKEIFPNWTNDPVIFQNSDTTFLGQFASSREGIRLDSADCIVFYNIDFSYLSYAQAKDRIISKEREKEAILYWVFSEGGIEEKIYEAVCAKKDYTNYIFRKDYGIRNSKKNKIET